MFSIELAQAWKSTAAANPSEFTKLPAGRYTCRIMSIKLDGPNIDRNLPPCLRYLLQVTDGPQKDATTEKADFINNAKSLSYIKLDMKTLGVREPASIEDIGLALQPARGKTVEIDVKYTTGNTGKEFMNVYIKRLVETMQPAGSSNTFSDGTPVPDDIPF